MAPRVDRAVTKHEELTRELRDLAGTLRPGDRFPSQSELMRRFHVSDRTVLRSLEDLSRAGWIVRRRGSGTFVTSCRHAPEPGTTGGSRTIAALALTCTPSRFYQHCLDVLSLLVEEAGGALIGQHARHETRYEAILPLEALAPAGFIALHYRLQPIARGLIERGHRAVIVGAPPVDVYPDVPCVTADHEQGGYLAARHLLELGHRRIGYARFNAGGELARTYRWQGHLRAQQEAARQGLRAQWSLLDPAMLAAWRAEPPRAADYFRRADAPTAVVAWNDSEADLVLRLCHAAGLRVPEELSVIGYDALPGGEQFLSPLTTVDQRVTTQLRCALNYLSQPVPPPVTHSAVIIPAVVRRASCAPPQRQ
jgi:DNA-binding LacI/PurR family transcriptional regulator